MRVKFWNGDKGRPGQIKRPCSCGCDERDGNIFGYYTQSDSRGRGLTVIFETEAEYQETRASMISARTEADARLCPAIGGA